eukprot:412153-Rhodomonas_salina.3
MKARHQSARVSLLHCEISDKKPRFAPGMRFLVFDFGVSSRACGRMAPGRGRRLTVRATERDRAPACRSRSV